MILAWAAVGSSASAARDASTTRRIRAGESGRITAIEHEQPAMVVVLQRARVARGSHLDDVDRLRALVARLFLVGHLRALGERLVAVAVDTRVVDEQVAAAFVGRNKAEAFVVTEPLDRPGTHHCSHVWPRQYADGLPLTDLARLGLLPGRSADRPLSRESFLADESSRKGSFTVFGGAGAVSRQPSDGEHCGPGDVTSAEKRTRPGSPIDFRVKRRYIVRAVGRE